ncbi:MAG: sigma 54-interacting transcriptional regulator, partial [Myxococcota bacterium]
IARALHRQSDTPQGPFVALNCATIPSSLAESMLFGHERGAFSGAAQRKLGLLEVADGGTLFLDEIANAPLNHQAKLLRVLQSGEYQRVGDTKVKFADVRVLSATNADLPRAVADGQFRADLLYRLNTVHIHVPPLRERREDIGPLTRHFLAREAKRRGQSVRELTPAAASAMQAHAWP